MTKNNKLYYYSEIEDQVIVNSIQADFQARQSQRKQIELDWELNLNFYLGNQYSYISSLNEISDIEKNYYWETREVYNHIAPIIESRLAKLNKIKPTLSAIPNSNSDKDVYSAKLTKSILKSTFENNSIENLISIATLWSEITGTAFYKVSWENDLGNIIGMVDDKQIKNGDVKITVCSPYEIYPDSNSTLEINDCESIIHARAVPISYIKNLWNVNVESDDISAYSINNSSAATNTHKNNITKITHIKLDNQVLLIERYEKPNLNNPKGRLTIVCKDKLLYDGELPYTINNQSTPYPFVKQVSIKQLASFWGASVISRCIPIQKAYNNLKNKKHEYITRLTSGVLTVEDGSVDIDNLESEGLAPGKILVYRNGSTPPQFLEAGTIPEELEKEEEKLLAELNNLSCISDITTNSSIPNNINSGSALNLLLEQEDSRLSLTAEYIRKSIKSLGIKTIHLYKQFANTIRLEKFSDLSGNIEVYYWTNSDLTTEDIILDSNNEFEESKETQRENLLSLYKIGLFSDKDGDIPNSTKEKILSTLGFQSWELPDNLNEIHKNRAMNENLGTTPLESPLEIDNHKIHIDEHIKFIISDTKNNINQEFKQSLLKHIKEHKQYIQSGE